jgi:hypothetical protein
MAADSHIGHRQPSQLTRSSFSRALSTLYFARTGISLLWVLAMSGLAASADLTSTPGRLIWTLLAIYPLTDAAATAADIRTTPRESQTVFQLVNLATSIAATVAVALAGALHGNITNAIEVFGVWAIASGVIQLVVALRRNSVISAQWFMIVSGGGSVVAGGTFLGWNGTTHDGIRTLVQYSTGGALWYAVAAIWLLASTRRLSRQPADIAPSSLTPTRPPWLGLPPNGPHWTCDE